MSTIATGEIFESLSAEYKYSAHIVDRYNSGKNWFLYTDDKERIVVIQVMDEIIRGSAVYSYETINSIIAWTDVYKHLDTLKTCFHCRNCLRNGIEADYNILGYNSETRAPFKGNVCFECLPLYDQDEKTITKETPISYEAKMMETIA